MAKPTVTAGNATKATDYANLVKYVSQGDIIDGSSGDTTLTASDFGRTVVVNSSSARIVYLPSVDATEIGGWFRVVKLGSGSVTVDAADSDVIADGAAGGTLSNGSAETDASVVLELSSAAKWTITGGHGTWATSMATHYPALRSTQKPTVAGATLDAEQTVKMISKPSNPASGYIHLYSKAGERLYTLTPSGAESQVASAQDVAPALGARRWGCWRARPGSTTPDYVMLAGTIGGGGGSTTASASGTEPAYLELYTQNLGGYLWGWSGASNSWESSKGQLFDVTIRIYYQQTTSVRVWAGLTDAIWTASNDDPSSRHLAMFRYSSVVGSPIYSVTKDGTTINAVSTGVAASAAWTTLRIVAVSASQIDFYVDGVLKNSHTANLPTAVLIPFIAVQTLAAASAYVRVGSFFGSFNG